MPHASLHKDQETSLERKTEEKGKQNGIKKDRGNDLSEPFQRKGGRRGFGGIRLVMGAAMHAHMLQWVYPNMIFICRGRPLPYL